MRLLREKCAQGQGGPCQHTSDAFNYSPEIWAPQRDEGVTKSSDDLHRLQNFPAEAFPALQEIFVQEIDPADLSREIWGERQYASGLILDDYFNPCEKACGRLAR